jgi:hypothetical protein
MTPDDLTKLSSHIENTIKLTVNGKIDALKDLVLDHNEKHERDMKEVRAHIEETKPILETYKGFNTAGNLIKWVAGVATALGVLWIMAVQLFKQ